MAIFSLISGSLGGWPFKLANFVLIGLLLPWLLLVALRWIGAGFAKDATDDT